MSKLSFDLGKGERKPATPRSIFHAEDAPLYALLILFIIATFALTAATIIELLRVFA